MKLIYDWNEFDHSTEFELKGQVFDIIQETAAYLHETTNDDPVVLNVIPRLAQLISKHECLASFKEPFSSLARAVGLWNYIDKNNAPSRDRLVAEAVSVPELGNISLHREQIGALNVLLAGRNLVLSAPTSFGKSLIIDALVLTGRYKRIVVILPTIALLDEFRRRFTRRFRDTYDIVMYSSETSAARNVIFLGTQERIIARSDLSKIDLLVVDEFYKLDTRSSSGKRDERSLILNASVYKLLKNSKQFFLLGPNIDHIRMDKTSPWNFQFLRTRFSTVAVDTFDLKNVDNKETRLIEEAFKEENWPVLIFVSSPKRANDIALLLANENRLHGHRSDLSLWIESNYGGKWELSKCVASGIGVHHGRIPRALSSRFVKLFNDGVLPILICTSTLIEGVNTAAQSVIIYDKKIEREDFDFFTFSNIRGRAGRLGQYHTGRVFLFNAPPDVSDVDVFPPVFLDYENAPDELAVYLEEDDAPASITQRVSVLTQSLGIGISDLQRLSGLGIDVLEKVRGIIAERVEEKHYLSWSGRPKWNEILELCEIVCRLRRSRDFGVRSPRQLAMWITKLRASTSMSEFFRWYSDGFTGDINEIDKVFLFLRSCEHSLPELFDAVQTFAIATGISADYSLLLDELPRWFRMDEVKQLEEQGVPMQITERFISSTDTLQDIRLKLFEASRNLDPKLSKIEQDWLTDALPL
ncbi:DEAD/DEAH box helicase [Methylobacterium sp. BTF04]|uniref:DEAD/DEAH box helicase n=1 Tax=Methylobacterium sp. BTF04 TaxID=2708300 RepID=UPI0013D36699|nr:DEAD/DEAH box helicase [Methylobacterium sp. BTF04]NEU11569.1 DEAD/DEAH box helicase [Methylobacterium sp. BTF04]